MFEAIFAHSKYALLFKDHRHSELFKQLWIGFVGRLEVIAELSDNGNHLGALDKFCDLVDYIFIDMNSTVYRDNNLAIVSHSVEHLYSDKLGPFKFRNKGRDYPGVYFIQKDGLDKIDSVHNNAFFIVFYLFSAEIILFEDFSGDDDLPLIGGGTPIPGDICIDLSGITLRECLVSMMSTTEDTVQGAKSKSTDPKSSNEGSVRSYSTFTNTNSFNKYEATRLVTGYKYEFKLVPNFWCILLN
jgi:hypothetical protein